MSSLNVRILGQCLTPLMPASALMIRSRSARLDHCKPGTYRPWQPGRHGLAAYHELGEIIGQAVT
ncbi:hypothetical protein [Pseudomonas sp. PA15(2017)]|uniref:hypothetical protein n=1 Tax=Pseudomonas sp. PA15(2017) TaxID=1932111 RepID=UPI00117A57D3|nr:hypothetical protein [Pseudomonas sp. PA15(2017)]